MPASKPLLHPVGRVASPITDRASAPKQGREGSPLAWLVFDAAVRDALADVRAGDEIIVLTWFDRARREVLQVHPRGDPANPVTGVFSTRSPDRPNPIGLHLVKVRAVEDGGRRLQVEDMEALDGTPILDVKPVIPGEIEA